MFYDNTNCSIASYAGDNTSYCNDLSLNKVIKKLEIYNSNLFKWVQENQIRAHADKYHPLVTNKSSVLGKIREFIIKNTKEKYR